MRTIDIKQIENEVSRLCIEAATYIEDDVLAAIKPGKPFKFILIGE